MGPDDEERYVVYEHANHGLARVFFQWEYVGKHMFRWVPFAVEYDLFTPVDVREVLTAELRAVRLDKSGSVSDDKAPPN